MAIPTPNIAVSVVPGGVQNYQFNGGIGVAGVGADLYIDLTAFPLRLRKDPFFQDQFVIAVKALEQGLTDISPAVLSAADFFDDGDEVNAYIKIAVTSDNAARQVLIDAALRHTAVR